MHLRFRFWGCQHLRGCEEISSKKKILFLGLQFTGYEADYLRWDEHNSLSGADILIVNPINIESFNLEQIELREILDYGEYPNINIDDYIAYYTTEVITLLEFGINVFIFPTYFKLEKQKRGDLVAHYLDPVGLGFESITESTGKDIDIDSCPKIFKKVFEGLNNFIGYDYILNNPHISFVSKIYNKHKKIVGGVIRYLKANIIILPLNRMANYSFSKSYDQSVVDLLIKNVLEIDENLSKQTNIVIPKWIENYTFIDEVKLISEKNSRLEEIKKVRESVLNIDKQLNEFNLLKSLLFSYSFNLEKSISFVFEKLGFEKIANNIPYEVDHIFKHEDNFLVCETKGKENQLKIEDLRQLIHNLTEWELHNRNESVGIIKGVLFVNQYCNEKPSQRKREFDPLLLKTIHNITIIDTYSIFNIIKDLLDNPVLIDKEKIIQSIFSSGKTFFYDSQSDTLKNGHN